MPAHVASSFAATHGIPDQRHVFDSAGRLHNVRQVVRVCIPVVTLPWLARTSETAAIIANHPVAGVHQLHRSAIEAVRVQGIPMNQNNRTAGSPILYKKFRVVPSFNQSHFSSPSGFSPCGLE